MITEKIYTGEKISIRQITLDDCTEEYVGWLNDNEINRFLETRWYTQNINTVRDFVESQRVNDHSFLFAIVDKGSRHIGNIKIGPINAYHHRADISYFIGRKDLWGTGIASEAINLICLFGFQILKLHKIEAGAYKEAVGSWKALEKNGFKREAILREQYMTGGQYMDAYRYGLLEFEFLKGANRRR